MRILKNKLLRILILGIIVVTVAIQTNIVQSIFQTPTAYAVGDLTVNWGVPEGNPIFVINNMAPGGSETRVVQVTNNAASGRPVAIKGVKTNETGSISGALTILIKDGVTTLYTSTLSQFFTDSLNPDGIPLNTINPGQTKNYTFVVTFNPGAGNEFQNKTVVFNIVLGIAVAIPEACSQIDLQGRFPIFGTSGNDNIRGTLKDDMIVTFEGNDTVHASLGNDCIIGGAGNDKLYGEVGNDFVFGNEGNDLLIGAEGNDFVTGGEGNDTIRGENGMDQLFGNEGNDIMTGGNGDDHMEGNAGNDAMNGENGIDTVLGGTDNDALIGGNGNDILTGELGTDSANGQNGTDTCDAETEVSCEI